jgi:hypothetical protein
MGIQHQVIEPINIIGQLPYGRSAAANIPLHLRAAGSVPCILSLTGIRLGSAMRSYKTNTIGPLDE